MQPANLDLTIFRGCTFGPVLITFNDAEGAPVDLTGWTAYATARPQAPGWPDTINLAPAITDPAAGQITISMADEQTAAITFGKWSYDLLLQNPSGEHLGPYLQGTLHVHSLNTRP